MTKLQLIIIGIIILFVIPSLLGALTARFFGWAAGIFIGVLALASIVSIYYRKMKGVKTQNKNTKEQNKHNNLPRG